MQVDYPPFLTRQCEMGQTRCVKPALGARQVGLVLVQDETKAVGTGLREQTDVMHMHIPRLGDMVERTRQLPRGRPESLLFDSAQATSVYRPASTCTGLPTRPTETMVSPVSPTGASLVWTSGALIAIADSVRV